MMIIICAFLGTWVKSLHWTRSMLPYSWPRSPSIVSARYYWDFLLFIPWVAAYSLVYWPLRCFTPCSVSCLPSILSSTDPLLRMSFLFVIGLVKTIYLQNKALNNFKSCLCIIKILQGSHLTASQVYWHILTWTLTYPSRVKGLGRRRKTTWPHSSSRPSTMSSSL